MLIGGVEGHKYMVCRYPFTPPFALAFSGVLASTRCQKGTVGTRMSSGGEQGLQQPDSRDSQRPHRLQSRVLQ